jgi:hypothetical protein
MWFYYLIISILCVPFNNSIYLSAPCYESALCADPAKAESNYKISMEGDLLPEIVVCFLFLPPTQKVSEKKHPLSAFLSNIVFKVKG